MPDRRGRELRVGPPVRRVAPHAERVANLERKIDVSAQFIEIHFCFDLHKRATILVGVGTLPSAKALRGIEGIAGVQLMDHRNEAA